MHHTTPHHIASHHIAFHCIGSLYFVGVDTCMLYSNNDAESIRIYAAKHECVTYDDDIFIWRSIKDTSIHTHTHPNTFKTVSIKNFTTDFPEHCCAHCTHCTATHYHYIYGTLCVQYVLNIVISTRLSFRLMEKFNFNFPVKWIKLKPHVQTTHTCYKTLQMFFDFYSSYCIHHAILPFSIKIWKWNSHECVLGKKQSRICVG